MRGVNGFENKRGQVWVETVIYILISFVMIGLVLSFVKPKIEEVRDRAIIEQTIELMNSIDKTISEIEKSTGNKRILDVGIKKGILEIDPENEKIQFILDSVYVYSEPGENISVGNINASTTKKGKYNEVLFALDYSGKYNITYKEKEESKTFTKASTSYKISLSNLGEDSSQKIIINFDLI